MLYISVSKESLYWYLGEEQMFQMGPYSLIKTNIICKTFDGKINI